MAALAGCRSPAAPADEVQLQVDLHRAALASRTLGRFAEFTLFEEELSELPCREPLSETNRTCDLRIVGRGAARLEVGSPALQATHRVDVNALVKVEYQARCENQAFDFKTLDTSLPRGGPGAPGETVWENHLVRAVHQKVGVGDAAQCRVIVQAAPALIGRLLAAGDARKR